MNPDGYKRCLSCGWVTVTDLHYFCANCGRALTTERAKRPDVTTMHLGVTGANYTGMSGVAAPPAESFPELAARIAADGERATTLDDHEERIKTLESRLDGLQARFNRQREYDQDERAGMKDRIETLVKMLDDWFYQGCMHTHPDGEEYGEVKRRLAAIESTITGLQHAAVETARVVLDDSPTPSCSYHAEGACLWHKKIPMAFLCDVTDCPVLKGLDADEEARKYAKRVNGLLAKNLKEELATWNRLSDEAWEQTESVGVPIIPSVWTVPSDQLTGTVTTNWKSSGTLLHLGGATSNPVGGNISYEYRDDPAHIVHEPGSDCPKHEVIGETTRDMTCRLCGEHFTGYEHDGKLEFDIIPACEKPEAGTIDCPSPVCQSCGVALAMDSYGILRCHDTANGIDSRMMLCVGCWKKATEPVKDKPRTYRYTNATCPQSDAYGASGGSCGGAWVCRECADDPKREREEADNA